MKFCFIGLGYSALVAVAWLGRVSHRVLRAALESPKRSLVKIGRTLIIEKGIKEVGHEASASGGHNHSQLARRMADAVHNPAGYGIQHVRVWDQTSKYFRADMDRTKKMLEDVCGAQFADIAQRTAHSAFVRLGPCQPRLVKTTSRV